MIDHHIQKSIVYALALTPSARFGELKPDDVENKLFDYHLKKVLATGLVEKLNSGEYTLTPLGRRVGKDALKKSDHLIDRAYSVIFMAIRRQSDGAWLLCRRKTHPLFDRVGFMNAQPELEVPIAETAAHVAAQKTGLQCDFQVRGSGYLRVYDDDQLESFTHFTLLECLDASGDLEQLDELAEYFWVVEPDFTAPEIMPTISLFAAKLAQPELFFIEETVRS